MNRDCCGECPHMVVARGRQACNGGFICRKERDDLRAENARLRALCADVVDDLTVDATVDGDRWREMLKIRIAERGPIAAGRGEGTK